MTNKKQNFDLTGTEMNKLISQINNYDDIEPISLDELEEIEAQYQASKSTHEIDAAPIKTLKHLRDKIFKDSEELDSLLGYAEKKGFDRRTLSQKLKISTDIVMKLHRRVLSWVPDTLVTHIGDLLDLPKTAVYVYLHKEPEGFKAAARSKQTPTGSRTQSWDEAVNSSNMSDDEKYFWLNQL